MAKISSSQILLAAFIVFNLSSLLVSAHRGHENCMHDSDEYQQRAHKKMYEYFQANPINRSDIEGRNLQSAVVINPIRVTSDMTALDSGSISASQATYLKSVSNTVVNFLKNFLKVQPNPGNNYFDYEQITDGTCLSVVVPANDKKGSTGIANSDLHLYFIYTSDSSKSFLANAGFCNIQVGTDYLRPNFGRVMFNIANMKATGTDYNQYENDIMVTLHEIIHVLGFSGGAIQNWYNKSTKQMLGSAGAAALIQSQTIRGNPTNLLKSTNVVKTAKKYYKCDSLIGMQLENQGGDGSIGSHWERTIIRSEIMTASALSEGLNLSVFTIALLKDTNYWDDVNENMTDNIYWGKGKGCDFFTNACQSSTKYEEFTTQNTEACSFWNDGQGKAAIDTFGDDCYSISPYSNALCEDPESGTGYPTDFNKNTLNDYSYNSKCLISSVYNPTFSGTYTNLQDQRCHQYQCTPDMTQITITFSQVSSFSVTCAAADKGLAKTVTYNSKNIGTITCPNDYQKFCDNQNCKNYCSYNGICIKGVCLCNATYTGDDCSKPCNVYADASGTCVTSCANGTYANPDNVCRATCPKGYYPNSASNINVCSLCDFSCSTCSGPSSSECTGCQFLTYLDSTSCSETCPTGKYGDDATRTCQTCPTGCADCTSSTVCGSCKSGYQKVGSICANTTCTGDCATCTTVQAECLSCKNNLYLKGTTCTSTCGNGYYPNPNNMTCNQCSTGCDTCSNDTTCSVCNTVGGYRLQGSSCTLCKVPCATCLANDVNKCTACESNKYLLNNVCYDTCPDNYYGGNNYQCAQCIEGCTKCTTASTCDTCNAAANYQIYTYNAKQVCILASTCYSPCQTCDGTFQPTTCKTCIANYYKQDSLCKVACDDGYFGNSTDFICNKCSTECTKCSVSATQCTACVSPKFALKGQCVTTCPTGYKAANGVCESTTTATTTSSIQQFSLLIIFVLLCLF